MRIILNEFSFREQPFPFSDSFSTRAFLDFLLNSINQIKCESIATMANFMSIEVYDGMLFASLFDSRENFSSEEARSLLFSSLTRNPHIEKIIADYESLHNTSYEFTKSQIAVHGLGAAWLEKTAVISLYASDCNTDLIEFEERHVDVMTGEICNQNISVANISNEDQAEKFKISIEIDQWENIKDGIELLETMIDQYPQVHIGPDAVNQIKRLRPNRKEFRFIVRHFKGIGEHSKNMMGKDVRVPGLTGSSESESTMNNKELKSMRVFRCRDNETRQFDFHTKPMGDIRIYVRKDNDIIHLGYVGDHLPTSTIK